MTYIWTEEDRERLIVDLRKFFPYFTFKREKATFAIIKFAEYVVVELDITYQDGKYMVGSKRKIDADCYERLRAFVIDSVAADKILRSYHTIESAKWNHAKLDRVEKKMDAIHTMLSCAPGGPEYLEAAERFKKIM
nr:hypothetical protein K-LCC10_0197 [Kaumoebavirus]